MTELIAWLVGHCQESKQCISTYTYSDLFGPDRNVKKIHSLYLQTSSHMMPSSSSLRPQDMTSAPGPNLDLHHVSSKASLNATTRPRAPSHLLQTGPPTIQIFQRESNAPPFLKQVASLPHEEPGTESLKPLKNSSQPPHIHYQNKPQ